MFCRNCGTKNEINNKFCKNCGMKLQIGNNQESDFEKAAKKKRNPIFVAVGIFILSALLYAGRELPEKILANQTNNISFSGYSFELPGTYNTTIKNETLTIKSSDFATNEVLIVKIYSTGFDSFLSDMKEMANKKEYIYNMESNDNYVIANYTIGDLKGAIALKKAENDDFFWIQTLADSNLRAKKILIDFMPILSNANKTGNNIENSKEDFSTTIKNKINKLLSEEQ